MIVSSRTSRHSAFQTENRTIIFLYDKFVCFVAKRLFNIVNVFVSFLPCPVLVKSNRTKSHKEASEAALQVDDNNKNQCKS